MRWRAPQGLRRCRDRAEGQRVLQDRLTCGSRCRRGQRKRKEQGQREGVLELVRVRLVEQRVEGQLVEGQQWKQWQWWWEWREYGHQAGGHYRQLINSLVVYSPLSCISAIASV